MNQSSHLPQLLISRVSGRLLGLQNLVTSLEGWQQHLLLDHFKAAT
jgi:hypothetical protein